MSYVVLARKWRPQTFSELVGQGPIVKTLENAIVLGRVSHAVLLTGSRGVGKTTTARILAKALNCEKGPTTHPCGECSNCREITAGSNVDVLEVDGASNTKVDEMRDLLENVQYRPAKSKYKIYIIDEVHMLSTHSFNALLKTLEEPPPEVMFIFATTEPHKIPDTILSRCQRFDFRQISDMQIAEHLRKIVESEKISVSDGGLMMIARQAAGGLRDALSLLDQVVAFCGEKITDEDVASVLGLTDRALIFATLEAFTTHDALAALEQLSQVFLKGFDPKNFITEIWGRVRDLLLLKTGVDAALVKATEDDRKRFKALVEKTDVAELERWFDLLKGLTNEIGRTEFPQYLAEVAFLRITRAAPRAPLSELVSRLEQLESRLTSGKPLTSAAGPVRVAPPVAAVMSPVAPVATAPVQADPPARKTDVKSMGPESWEKLVGQVKQRKPAWAAILLQAAQASMEDEKIVLTYDDGSFYESRAKDADFQNFLCGLAVEMFGGRFTMGILTRKKVPTEAREGVDRTREREALKNPIVQKAVSLFDARIEEVKPLK